MEIRASLLEFVLFIVPWIAAVGWLCSRVLGISLGRWRATVVAIVGWLGGVIATAVIVDKHETLWVVVPMTLFFGVIVAMPTAIVLDLITRSTRTRTTHRVRRTLLHPIRTTKNTFAPIGRMRELVRDARHHNLVHVRYRSEYAVDTADFALRLRLTIEDAGGMMVKFGQIASTRTDLLPDSLTSVADWAFSSCASLTNVTIPSSLASISAWIFYNCASLTRVTIPLGVTSIGDGAFSSCTSLTAVTIPGSVRSCRC